MSSTDRISGNSIVLRVAQNGSSGNEEPFVKEVKKAPYAVVVCPAFISTGGVYSIVVRSSVSGNYTLLVDTSAAQFVDATSGADGNGTGLFTDASGGRNGSQKIYFFDVPAAAAQRFLSVRVSSLAGDGTALPLPLNDVYLSVDRCPSASCPGKSVSKPNGHCDWDAHAAVKRDRLVKLNAIRATPGRYCMCCCFVSVCVHS